MGPYRKSVLQNAMLRSKQQLQHPALNMCVSLTTLIRERSACPQAEPVAAADAAAEPEEDVQMEELEHEIEAAAAPEEPEEAEDELAGEMEEEENTGKPPSIGVPAQQFSRSRIHFGSRILSGLPIFKTASGERMPHRLAPSAFPSWAWRPPAPPMLQDRSWP